MKLNSKSINFSVDTVEELTSLDGVNGDICILTDEDRGGTFIYDGSYWIEQATKAQLPSSIVATNLSIGKNALSSYSGSVGLNTAFGYNSAGKVTIGGNNTSVGANSHFQNQAGNNSVALGENAHRNMGVDGSAPAYNTAIGMGAMYVKSTGSCNTAVGADAFASFKDNADRVIGDATGVYHDWKDNLNTGGSYNTAIGQNAITYSSGDNNTAVGASSGVYATTGSNNTIIGTLAGAASGPSVSGNFLESGSYNTFLGSNASCSYALRTSNYMTAIGAGSLVSSTDTVVLGRTNDVTVIGKTSRANNSTTVNSNLQLGYGILLGNSNDCGTNVLSWYEETTATITATGLTGSPTITCKTTRIGRQCFVHITIYAGGSVHSGVTPSLVGLPWACVMASTCTTVNTSSGANSVGTIQYYSGNTHIDIPTYTATAGQIVISGTYLAKA